MHLSRRLAFKPEAGHGFFDCHVNGSREFLSCPVRDRQLSVVLHGPMAPCRESVVLHGSQSPKGLDSLG